MVHVLGDIIG